MAGKGTKPKANHPWRHSALPKVEKWAKEQSDIRDVNNVTVARPETLSRRTRNGEVGQI